VNESRRALRVVDGHLADRRWMMGDDYTIADISIFPWVRNLIGFYEAGDLVEVESRRGRLVVPVVASEAGRPGTGYLPMHWGSATLAGRGSAGINAVTAKAFCPTSKQPELKHAAVRIAKVELPWRLCAFGYSGRDADLVALRDRIRELACGFDYASVVLIGSERAGILLRAASAEPCAQDTVAAIDRAFGLDAIDVLRYDDPKRAIGRRVLLSAGRLCAVRLSGDLAGEAWLREWLVGGEDVSAMRAALMVPSARAFTAPWSAVNRNSSRLTPDAACTAKVQLTCWGGASSSPRQSAGVMPWKASGASRWATH